MWQRRQQLPHLGALVEPSWEKLARGRQPGCGEGVPCRRGCSCGVCQLLKPLCKQHNKRNWHGNDPDFAEKKLKDSEGIICQDFRQSPTKVEGGSQ